ncbi:polysaccharide deacetylase family protein [[Ruminococcus] gnavus]|uniref:Polysaccharide deacetylase family protein n=1 Tax=Mediterraneibacter gnavus TaxID=33038 RepID=A0AAW6JZJ0_MEDGN|nr:polysaccharide deacetylase family protein [Mediterraneibacter gnavus]MDC6139832.1 polysaccharide deacetylase family protein [Mediterraneibacter gnavus]MDE1203398.1 polysaccharide deacetylase family protein [Mediterraneibacter gnavus]
MNIYRIISGVKQRLLAKKYMHKKNDTFIFMFHEVTNGEAAIYEDISITKENFSLLLNEIAKKNFLFDSIEDIFKEKDRRVIITFDDIFQNAYENAIPILNERNIPYTVFITSEYVDKEGYITSSEVEKLKQNKLCTVGFHANKHDLMCDLSDDDIKVNTSAKTFERRFDIKCDYFAFPFGSVYACPKRSVSIASTQGYKAVFSTIDSPVSNNDIRRNPWFIPRICVSDHKWENILKKLS